MAGTNTVAHDVVDILDSGIAAAWYNGLCPDPLLTIAEWAERYRILAGKASAERGPWRNARTPYLVAIMEALSPTDPAEVVVFMAGAQVGKALPLDTPIPTPTGWSTMGALRVGDRVLGASGLPCTVTVTSPVYRERRCWELTFSDGARLVADGAHRWTVDDAGTAGHQGGARRRTLTTADLAGSTTRRGRHRYAIPVAGALQLPARELPLPPYAFGYWLGDGHSYSNRITTHEDDAATVAGFLRADGVRVTLDRRWSTGRCVELVLDPHAPGVVCRRGHDTRVGGLLTFTRRGKPATRCLVCHRQSARVAGRKRGGWTPRLGGQDPVVARPSFGAHLARLGVLGRKHIPPTYLRADVLQRRDLLAGLMDSDGHVTKRGRCEITFADPRLAADVTELLHTLGFKPTVARRPGCTRIGFAAYRGEGVCRLVRKATRLRERDATRRPSVARRRRIVAVRAVPSVPVRCIAVTAADALYLAGRSFIPTHNTECGNNFAGYVIHQAPGPMLAVWGSLEMAKRESRIRLDATIEATPVLRALVSPVRERDSGNTRLSKDFPGGVYVLTGANSAVGLRAMAARYLHLDEVDTFPGDADGEGDPVALARRATRTFGRRKKIFLCSTPKISGLSRIEREFQACERQFVYHVPCPACGFRQQLLWENFRYTLPPGYTTTGASGELIEVPGVTVVCQGCQTPIAEHHKTALLRDGAWVCVRDMGRRSVGFHLSALYSPVGWFSWGEAAAMYERAKTRPEDAKVFSNTVLGLPYAEQHDAPDWHRLYERREPYDQGTVPPGALFLTAGVDVQANRVEVEIVGWGPGKESWSVAYLVLDGDTQLDTVWAQLDALLAQDWPTSEGDVMPIRVLAIDSGFATQRVYAWARTHPQAAHGPAGSSARVPRTVVVVKGTDRWGSIVYAPQKSGADEKKRGLKVWPVGSSGAKRELYQWLRLDALTDEQRRAGLTGPAGFLHFPEYGEDWFKQLTAEKLVVTIVKGFPRETWQKDANARNEALDARVYARAAAAVFGLDRLQERHWQRLAALRGGVVGPLAPVASGGVRSAPVAALPVPPIALPVAPVRPVAAPARSRVIRSGWLCR